MCYSFVLSIKYHLLDRLFEFFISIHDRLSERARIEGDFDSGIVDVRANAIELQRPPKVTYLLALVIIIFTQWNITFFSLFFGRLFTWIMCLVHPLYFSPSLWIVGSHGRYKLDFRLHFSLWVIHYVENCIVDLLVVRS